MKSLSVKQLANYTVEQLENGASWSLLTKQIAAELETSSRRKQVDQVVSEIAFELENRQLLAIATVHTAIPLGTATRQKIESFIKKETGVKSVKIESVINPSILSGVHIEIASRTWDLTGKSLLWSLTKAGGNV